MQYVVTPPGGQPVIVEITGDEPSEQQITHLLERAGWEIQERMPPARVILAPEPLPTEPDERLKGTRPWTSRSPDVERDETQHKIWDEE